VAVRKPEGHAFAEMSPIRSPVLYRGVHGKVRNGEDEDMEDTKDTTRDLLLGISESCNKSYEDYLRRHALRSHEALPHALPGQVVLGVEAPSFFATRQTNMALQVVSSHHLGVLEIESVLSVESALVERLLPHAASEAEALKNRHSPRIFVLDGCSLTHPLGPLSNRLRANSPGSKILALLAPDRCGEGEMVCLFHWGADGMLVLDEDWKSQLPRAALALLANRLWVQPEVLLAFVLQMKTLRDRQLLPGQVLTGRENQVLQLLFRRLTNKEIACDLNISERTAKFHVCNVLNKLGFESRENLLETLGCETI
jgi:DNA-binding NarL/FixJ family response regulator